MQRFVALLVPLEKNTKCKVASCRTRDDFGLCQDLNQIIKFLFFCKKSKINWVFFLMIKADGQEN